MRYPLQNLSIAKMYLHMNILYPWRCRQITLMSSV